MDETILKVSNLTKRYDNKVAVDNISFTVNKGEIFGILGPNGAGKTTTLEMIEALRPITSGEIVVDGINVKKDPKKVKQIVGIQLQLAAFLDKVTLREHLKLFADIYHVKTNVDDILNEVQLSEKANSFVEDLSGGQKQRFSVAIAIVNNPKVLFLDEPTTGLDPQARHNLWELIKSIKQKGTTIIITTHYMEEAQLLCDRLAVLDNGKIIALDSPQGLIDNLIKSGFQPKRVVQNVTLEDAYINLTGKELRD